MIVRPAGDAVSDWKAPWGAFRRRGWGVGVLIGVFRCLRGSTPHTAARGALVMGEAGKSTSR